MSMKRLLMIAFISMAVPTGIAAFAQDEVDEDVTEGTVEVKAEAKAEAKTDEKTEAKAEETTTEEAAQPAAELKPIRQSKDSVPAENLKAVDDQIKEAEQEKTAVEQELQSIENKTFTEKATKAVLMYIPNRIMDALDIFTLDLGMGVNAKLDVYLTRAFGFGAGIGPNADLFKDFNRQYGFATQQGWNWQFMFVGAAEQSRSDTCGTVQPFSQSYSGMALPSELVYQSRAEDYWAIGVDAAALINVKAMIHPTEIADFILGLFFIDVISEDDYSL